MDTQKTPSQKPVRHILSLSGGKDSTALAIYMKDRLTEVEYVFCDTGEELPETYDFLDKLEVYLGKQINRLNPDRPFKHYLNVYRGVLPDSRTRWCTRKLKIEPFEKYVGEDVCVSYVGIRADESHRKGYISTKTNISARYPFIEDGITKQDVFRILEDSGVGIPDYYRWRSRSGCYFCFFQQRIEWVGLLREHPVYYEKAKAFEKIDLETNERYTWCQNESLDELAQVERRDQILNDHEQKVQKGSVSRKTNLSLGEVFSLDDEGEDGCLVCHL